MAEKQIDLIEISDSSPDAKTRISSPVLCLKDKSMIKKYEEKEDFFILEFDPYDELEILKHADNADADLIMVSEKGKVACRDYPHPRHTCAKFPFFKTPHDAHCEMCYCYVCESSAPCSEWVEFHCNAFDSMYWNEERENSHCKGRSLCTSTQAETWHF